MAGNVCPQCGAQIDLGASECKFCGEKLATQQAAQQIQQPQPQTVYVQQPQPQTVYVQQPQPQVIVQQVPVSAIDPSWPVKSKVAAGLLAIFLGGIGIHKFYMGKIGMGILYICFCWTYIPAVVGVVEGIIYLCSNDENFQLKHHVRLQ